jgi:hypothetical protein
LRRLSHIVITETMLTAIKVLRMRGWWKFEAIDDRMDVEFENLRGNRDIAIIEPDDRRRMPSGIR